MRTARSPSTPARNRSQDTFMLIWQSPLVKTKQVEALAAHTRGAAECLVQDDNRGCAILCEEGRAPKGVVERRVSPLFVSGRSGPEAGPWVFSVGVWTPEDWREEFCAWYQYEHGPLLLECLEWRGFQFLEMSTADGYQFYILHRLAARRALDSEQRKRSRATPWFRRLAKNKWFDKAFERILYRRINLLWH
jgi:hypothetical protein